MKHLGPSRFVGTAHFASWTLGAALVMVVASSIEAQATPGDERGGVQIEYVAHASFLFTTPDGVELLIDPFQSRVWLGYDFPAGLDPDVILITHPHYDHDAGRYRGADFPWPDTPIFDAPGRLELGDATVVGVEAKHADPYGKEFGQRNTVMVLEVGGLRIAHLGDNGPLTERNLNELGRIDVLMLPADGVDHILSKAETSEIIDRLHPRVIIPMHYRLPDLESDPESPSDLGEIEPWLVGRENVRRLGSHRAVLRAADLPSETSIWRFDHAPYVRAAAPGG